MDVYRRGELGAHAPHTLAGRTEPLLLFAFDDQDVRAARFGEVICNTRSDDPAADDDDICCFYHCSLRCMKDCLTNPIATPIAHCTLACGSDNSRNALLRVNLQCGIGD